MVRLSGAFIEIHKVVDPDGTPVETKIAETRDDIDIGLDVGEASGRAHGERTVQRTPVSATQTFGFNGFVVDDHANLTALGILESGKIRPWSKAKLEAIRLKVFARDGDAAASQMWLLRDVELILSNVNFAQDDYATFEAEAWVNGTIDNEAV